MSLYISITTASSTLSDSPINNAITALATRLAGKKVQGDTPCGPVLDMTFMLPGRDEQPEFSGMRMGGYTSEGDTLYFETAVPSHIVYSQQAGEYVAMVMEDMVANAQAFFYENDVDFDVIQWQLYVAQIAGSENHIPEMH